MAEPIVAALASHLKDSFEVAAFVGDHVYHGFAPTNSTLPRIIIRLVSTAHLRHYSEVAGLRRSVIDVFIYDDNPADAEQVAEATRKALDHKVGEAIGTANTITIRAAFLDGDREGAIMRDDNSGRAVYEYVQSWTLWHAETVPS